jgi:hypothetical protein
MKYKLDLNTLKSSPKIAWKLNSFSGIEIKLDGEPMFMNGALTSEHILNQIKEASKPSFKKYENKE